MFMYYWIYGHMDKQEMEIIETGNGNWKLKTEIKTQSLRCCSPRMLLAPRHPSALLASSLLLVALLAYPCSQAFAIPSCSNKV